MIFTQEFAPQTGRLPKLEETGTDWFTTDIGETHHSRDSVEAVDSLEENPAERMDVEGFAESLHALIGVLAELGQTAKNFSNRHR